MPAHRADDPSFPPPPSLYKNLVACTQVCLTLNTCLIHTPASLLWLLAMVVIGNPSDNDSAQKPPSPPSARVSDTRGSAEPESQLLSFLPVWLPWPWMSFWPMVAWPLGPPDTCRPLVPLQTSKLISGPIIYFCLLQVVASAKCNLQSWPGQKLGPYYMWWPSAVCWKPHWSYYTRIWFGVSSLPKSPQKVQFHFFSGTVLLKQLAASQGSPPKPLGVQDLITAISC